MTTLLWRTETGQGVDVHRDDCADIARTVKRYRLFPHNVEIVTGPEGATKQTLVEYVMCDFIDEDNPWTNYRDELNFAPCWKETR